MRALRTAPALALGRMDRGVPWLRLQRSAAVIVG